MKKRFITPGRHRFEIPPGVRRFTVVQQGGGGGGSDDEPGEAGARTTQIYEIPTGVNCDHMDIYVGRGGSPNDGGLPGEDGWCEIEW